MTTESGRSGRPISRRTGRAATASAAPLAIDRAVFPDLAARRAAGDPRRVRWDALVAGAPGISGASGASGAPILADGGMGTMLFAAGLTFGDPPDAWNVERPAAVAAIHRGYLDAGSRIVLTNTFGGNRLRMAMHGNQDRVAEINAAAVAVLRAEVAASGADALVAGDIGPSGAIMAPVGPLTEAEAADIFEEQARALVDTGVDLVWVETMSDLAEMRAAIAGVRRASPSIPLICTMTFDTRGRTMMGVTAAQAVSTLVALGADAVGGNCGNGPDELLPVIEAMHAADPDALLVAKPNAGIPRIVETRAVYDASPTVMAGEAVRFRAAGARIIGACCGSMPAHLAAMAAALEA